MRIFDINKHAPVIFWLLVLAFIIGISSYMFFVQSSVYYILSVNEVKGVLSKQEVEFADLDSQYYKLTNKLSLNYALDSGFVEITNQTFARIRTNTDVARIR